MVTRLGEFSPLRQIFKMTQAALISLYLFHRNRFTVNLAKYGLGHILGNFFTKNHLVTVAPVQQSELEYFIGFCLPLLGWHEKGRL
jgi:hypothetical protein